jgi:hypothetical protein
MSTESNHMKSDSAIGEILSLRDYKSNRAEQIAHLHTAINRIDLAIKQLRPSQEYPSILDALKKLELARQQLSEQLERL